MEEGELFELATAFCRRNLFKLLTKSGEVFGECWGLGLGVGDLGLAWLVVGTGSRRGVVLFNA